MKFILDGRTRNPFPLKVSRCTKCGDGWGYCWYTSKNWSFLNFFSSSVHFLGHISLINSLPHFQVWIIPPYEIHIFGPLLLFCSDHSYCGWFFGCDWVLPTTQERSTGLWNCVRGSELVLVLAAAINILETGEKHIAVFLQPNHLCILLQRLVYDTAWLHRASNLCDHDYTKNGCICCRFEGEVALPIDMAEKEYPLMILESGWAKRLCHWSNLGGLRYSRPGFLFKVSIPCYPVFKGSERKVERGTTISIVDDTVWSSSKSHVHW
jgi:hypothetical protein